MVSRTRKQRKYAQTARDSKTGESVRFSIEWDMAYLTGMVVDRARFNKGGRAKWGPLAVYVHPEDRR